MPAPASPPRSSGLRSLLDGWRVLTTAQQRTAAAALVLLVSLQAPWYSTDTVTRGAGGALERSDGTLSGFGGFSFVEAAVLLVAFAVLVLTWARATEKRFTLPFDDGTLVTAAAGWAGLLVVYRLFDRPSGKSGPQLSTLVGLSWGIFATLLAVGLLLATGLAQRRIALAARGPRGASGHARDDARPAVDPRDVVRSDGPGDGGTPATPVGGHAPDGRPREAPAARDEWDVPEAIASRPDREPRRPSGGHDATRALGREDAARVLRDAGLDERPAAGPPTASEDVTRAQPASGSWSWDDEAPTRAAGPAAGGDGATPAPDTAPASPGPPPVPTEDEATRVVPRSAPAAAPPASPASAPPADPTPTAAPDEAPTTVRRAPAEAPTRQQSAETAAARPPAAAAPTRQQALEPPSGGRRGWWRKPRD